MLAWLTWEVQCEAVESMPVQHVQSAQLDPGIRRELGAVKQQNDGPACTRLTRRRRLAHRHAQALVLVRQNSQVLVL